MNSRRKTHRGFACVCELRSNKRYRRRASRSRQPIAAWRVQTTVLFCLIACKFDVVPCVSVHMLHTRPL